MSQSCVSQSSVRQRCVSQSCVNQSCVSQSCVCQSCVSQSCESQSCVLVRQSCVSQTSADFITHHSRTLTASLKSPLTTLTTQLLATLTSPPLSPPHHSRRLTTQPLTTLTPSPLSMHRYPANKIIIVIVQVDIAGLGTLRWGEVGSGRRGGE